MHRVNSEKPPAYSHPPLRLLLLAGLLAAPAAAQPFRVALSSPADNAVAVPLSDTLRLTFTAPLAPGVLPSIATFPAALITFGEPTLSVDGLTLSYPVTHTAGTRYVHLVLAARASDGTSLERPFAVAYTTAGSAGTFMVAGTVSAAVGSVDASIVALMGFDGADVTVVDAAVLNGPAGNYTLGPAPFGVYTVGSVRLPHADPDRTFAFGFYDPDGDGVPNPVVLPFNVNVTISEPAPVLARARFADALAEAQARAADAAHFEIAEGPVDTTGRAPVWTYTFYSPAQDTTIQVVETGIIPLTFATAGHPEGLAPIFDGWVDSDVALAAAEGAGGAAFRAAHAGEVQALTLRSGLQHDVPTAVTPAHRVAYRALDAGGTIVDSLLVYVHIYTGEVIATTRNEPGPPATSVRLEPPAPNPSAGGVSIAYSIEAPQHIRLEVLDALGRRVALLEDGARSAGRHVATWNTGALPAGAYLVRLSADGAAAVRVVVVRP